MNSHGVLLATRLDPPDPDAASQWRQLAADEGSQGHPCAWRIWPVLGVHNRRFQTSVRRRRHASADDQNEKNQPSQFISEDVELSGVAATAGSTVVKCLAAATRDQEVFGDPERMDLARTANTHLASGAGSHSCLGQALARTELQVCLDVLLTRLPTLALAVPVAKLSPRTGLVVGGLDETASHLVKEPITMRGLTNKAIVVCGGASGIGVATATQVGDEGARVVVGDINAAGAKKTAARITDAGGVGIGVAFDLADDDSAAALIGRAVDERGTVHGLFNCGADVSPDTIGRDVELLEADFAVWRRTLEVNWMGFARTARAVIPLLLEQGGAIVNTASGLLSAVSRSDPPTPRRRRR